MGEGFAEMEEAMQEGSEFGECHCHLVEVVLLLCFGPS